MQSLIDVLGFLTCFVLASLPVLKIQAIGHENTKSNNKSKL